MAVVHKISSCARSRSIVGGRVHAVVVVTQIELMLEQRPATGLASGACLPASELFEHRVDRLVVVRLLLLRLDWMSGAVEHMLVAALRRDSSLADLRDRLVVHSVEGTVVRLRRRIGRMLEMGWVWMASSNWR